jgi:DNA-binding transcriptional regulator YbjK
MTPERRETLEDAIQEEIKRHGCHALSDEELETVARCLGVN